MLKTLRLLAPVLLPSWRFFDRIAASPRIEVQRLGANGEAVGDWWASRPRPQSLPLGVYLRRLVWNPRWNEALFLTSCAERLLDSPSDHSVREISTRIAEDLPADAALPFFRFRLVLVSRVGEALQRKVAYVSPRQAAPPE
ncbi:hypothetical protein [Pelagibius sp.]|uniref:hypothetical protein n=1 Tax=Pelagibius sp. TaxID=1931238 RepID=UPI002607FCA1|nr:hypothetical protein [Pelagibius sp.]